VTIGPVAPLHREVQVACDAHTAFELFTAHIGTWWPMATHSVHGERATIAFEDGRLVERVGTESALWGEVLHWDPPRGFRITWHPGHPPTRATEVAVTFEPAGPDGATTLVTLTHTGWERIERGEQVRAQYVHGWPVVLGQFRAATMTP
jgi:uncharacterized protein YndB with AHSA1/START domain